MKKRSADDAIRAALARDDPAAVELIWDRYAGDLFAFLQAMLRCRQDAEDVLQMVFVKIVRKRRHLAGARRLDAYVYQIARNEASRFLKQRGKRAVEARDGSWLSPAEADNVRREWAEHLQHALERLPDGQREVIVLKIYREKTFKEIARMLDLSANTVASRYRYGMERLRILLKDAKS